MAESGTPLKGGVITGGTGLQYGGKYYGGGIDVKSNGARLYIGEGVNIVGNTADEGGGIYVEQNSANNDVDDSAIGAVIMNGGSLIGNTAVTGGGVRVNKHSFIEMNDGSLIYDNTAASDGGGVYVFEGWSSLTMNPGSVIDGNSGASGGGIYSDGGSVLINGGKVINNKAAKDYGAAINTKDNQYCSLRIIDGVITGNRANVSCALTVNNPLEIGGKTVIENNFGGNGEPSDLYLGSYTVNKTATPVAVQYAGAPEDGMHIGVVAGSDADVTILESGATQTDEKYFFADQDDRYITRDGGALMLKKIPASYYKVKVAYNENGIVYTDKQIAKNGETVALMPLPNDGYLLAGLTASDGSSDIPVSADQKFTMGTALVTVTAEFEELLPHIHDMGTPEDTTDDITFQPIEDLDALKKLFAEGGSGYLMNDISINADGVQPLIVDESKVVNLCLNDKMLNLGGQWIAVINSASFNLYDCGKTVRYWDKAEYRPWTLKTTADTSDCTTTGGVITGSTVDGAVNVSRSGSFTMNSGTICGNYSNTRCSGVNVFRKGSFTMNGGSITGNAVISGVNVTDWGSSFTMNGGSITGNENWSGVNVTEYGSFTMNGGTINDNYATQGGVCVTQYGSFTMNGGDICGNKGSLGGGVRNDYSSFTMNGGTICGNEATNGGGVYNYGNMTMLGGTITGNTCSDTEASGGGIHNEDTLILGGTAVVKGNFKNGTPNDVENCWSSTTISTDKKPAEGMEVGLYGENTVVTGAVSGDETFFFASDSENYEAVYDSGSVKLQKRKYSYIDADGEEQELPSEVTKHVAAGTDTQWNTDWVFVTGNVKIENAVTLSNDVNLILADGASLEITGGITGGKTLTVYGQTNGTGKLTVNSETDAYGMSATGLNGSITVNGGNVKITGKAIKSSGTGVEGNVTINGGSIEITAIGSNDDCSYGVMWGSVTVNGGTATISANDGCFGYGVMEGSLTVNSGSAAISGHDAGVVGDVTVTGGTAAISGLVCGVMNPIGMTSGITVSGDGELTLSGSEQAVSVPTVLATVQYSDADDGKAYDKEWDGKTDLTQKYLKLTKPHEHSFTSYSADGATLTAVCTGTVGTCRLPDTQMTITLTDNIAANAAAVKAWNDAGAAEITIKYYAESDTEFKNPLDAPVASGKYTVRATVNGKTAELADFDYVSPYRYLNEENEMVDPETIPTIVTPDTVSWSGCMFVTGEVEICDPVTMTDDVNLILADGASLEITGSITSDNKTLSVYVQPNAAGSLTVNSTGANAISGNITVNGGSFTVTSEYDGKAVGVSGNVTVNSGSVEISSTSTGDTIYDSGNGVLGNVTVNGGSVKISGKATGSVTGYGVKGSVSVSGGSAEITGSGKKGYGNGSNIRISGDGVLMLYGKTRATLAGPDKVIATVQTSADGTTYTDWDGTTDLSTCKYLKLTSAHTHSFTYTADGAVLTAVCGSTEGTCSLTDQKISLTLTAEDAFYDGEAYDGASTDDTTVKFAETTGATVTIEYRTTGEGAEKLDAAPTNAGSYVAKVTVGDAAAEKAFTINPRTVTLVAGSDEKTYDGNPLTCTGFTVKADTDPATPGYGFVGEEGIASVTMTAASTITNAGSTDNVIDTKTAKSNTNLANYTVTAETGTLTVKALAETAPAAGTGYTLDYTAETLKADADYEVSSTNGDTATALTNDKVTPGSTEQTIYVRRKASDTNHAPSAWTAITIPACPTAPTTGSTASATANSITVSEMTDAEYSVDGVNWQDSNVLTGLTAATEYTVYIRLKATATEFASAAQKIENVCTAAETPANAAAAGTISCGDESFELTDDYEISTKNGTGEGDTFEDGKLTPDADGKVTLEPGKTYYIRKAASGNIPASEAVSLTIPARPAAPAESDFTVTEETVENKKDGSVSGITEAMEYSLDGGATWVSGPAVLENLSNETVTVRTKATDTAFSGEEFTFTFTPSEEKLTISINGTETEAAYGDKLTKPAPDPEKSGCTFGGWYTDEAYTKAWNFGLDTVKDNTTLYPKWIDNTRQTAAISGSITQKGSGAVSGAVVELFLGTDRIAASVTDADGSYSFDNVENRTYNIVVTDAEGKTTTALVTVNTTGDFPVDVEFPEKTITSVVEIAGNTGAADKLKSDFCRTVVGGLDEIANAAAPDEGENVTIKLTVEPKDDTAENAGSIKTLAGIGKKVEFFDLTLTKTVNGVNTPDFGSTNTRLLTIVIPFDFTGVKVDSVKVLRYHDAAEMLTKDPAADEEGFTIDTQNGTVTIFAKQFSTYAVVYEEKQNNPYIPVSPGYSVVGEDTENGKLIISRKSGSADQTVTITVTPDEGYQLKTLTVKDEKGNVLTLTKLSDTEYTFRMPSGKVTVSADFMEVKTVCPQDETCVYAKFTDTDTKAWYHDGIHFCVENGYMKGISDTQFAPAETTTRAMIVTMLWRMEGEPAADYAMSFKDVPADEWYTEAIRWAQSAKIVEGYGADAFGPNDPITREQMVLILYRYAKFHEIDVTNDNTLEAYTDTEMISAWALDAIKWANAVGLMLGRTTTTLAPNAEITRAEAAAMIQRYCGKVCED